MKDTKMNILIIDNYDSFTFNLYQYIGEILDSTYSNYRLDVIRNDEMTLDEIKSRSYQKIVISPGPGDSKDKEYFGVCGDVITKLGDKVSILGVCLGMQGIAHYFGGRVIRAKLPMHGKISNIVHDNKGVFAGLPENIEVMRYHSLVVEINSLPECLEISSKVINPDGSFEIMGLRHKTCPIEGIQFHPESFGTEGGKKMLENFLITL